MNKSKKKITKATIFSDVYFCVTAQFIKNTMQLTPEAAQTPGASDQEFEYTTPPAQTLKSF